MDQFQFQFESESDCVCKSRLFKYVSKVKCGQCVCACTKRKTVYCWSILIKYRVVSESPRLLDFHFGCYERYCGHESMGKRISTCSRFLCR